MFSYELIFSNRKNIKIKFYIIEANWSKLELTWRPLEPYPGGQPGTDVILQVQQT